MKFHVYYLYIWYGIIAVGSLSQMIQGTFGTLMFVGSLIDMAIPTVIYFAYLAYKKKKDGKNEP